MSASADAVQFLRGLMLPVLTPLGVVAAWANTNFKPQLGQAYVEDSLLNWRITRAELGAGMRRGRLLYQVTLVYPHRDGFHAAANWVGLIENAWSAANLVTALGHALRVQSIGTGPAFPEPPNWYRLPVTVTADVDY